MFYTQLDKISTNALKDIVSKTNDVNNLPNRVLMHNKLPNDIIDKLSPSKYAYVRRALLKPKHYQKIVDNYVNSEDYSSEHVRNNAGHFTKEHLDKMSNVRRDDTTELVMNEPNFDKSHYNNLIKAPDDFRYSKRLLPLLQHSKFATLEDLKNIMVSYLI